MALVPPQHRLPPLRHPGVAPHRRGQLRPHHTRPGLGSLSMSSIRLFNYRADFPVITYLKIVRCVLCPHILFFHPQVAGFLLFPANFPLFYCSECFCGLLFCFANHHIHSPPDVLSPCPGASPTDQAAGTVASRRQPGGPRPSPILSSVVVPCPRDGPTPCRRHAPVPPFPLHPPPIPMRPHRPSDPPIHPIPQ